jgi:hypothetical protein
MMENMDWQIVRVAWRMLEVGLRSVVERMCFYLGD